MQSFRRYQNMRIIDRDMNIAEGDYILEGITIRTKKVISMIQKMKKEIIYRHLRHMTENMWSTGKTEFFIMRTVLL